MSKLRIRRAKPEDLMDIADIVLDSFVSEINGNIKELEGTDVANKDKFYNFYVQRALSKNKKRLIQLKIQPGDSSTEVDSVGITFRRFPKLIETA